MLGKTALITGSTSSVGFRVAEALAAGGARVALNGRDAAAGRNAIERLAHTGAECVFEAGDASRPEEMERVVEQASKRLGPIDILVTSGGSERMGPRLFQDLRPEDFLQAFENRFLPKVLPVQAVLPHMRARNTGSIVLITTDAARHVTPGEALIGAAGAAVLLMTKALARELSRWRIRVNAVALTITSDTAGYEAVFSQQTLGNKIFSKALERFPFGAAPTASEVARVVAFLASDQASQVTGQTISVNGGLSFGGW